MEKNLRLRGFDFVSAAMAFFDDHAIRMPNTSSVEEDRFEQIAFVDSVRFLVVVSTVREYEGQESYRIISARQATKTEQKTYLRGY